MNMEQLLEIKDSEWPKDQSVLKIRKAARAVILDENGLVPMLFVSRRNFHKLPGGGVDAGENLMEALIREVKEEVGCEIEVMKEVGTILEFRSKWNLKQTSYCYIGKATSKGVPKFTDNEIEEGFQLIWLPLEEAIAKITNDTTDDYEGGFILQRDLIFLKKAQQIINKQGLASSN